MGKGCDCSHCPGCGDVSEEPKKKKADDSAIKPDDADTEDIEEIDLGDDDFGDDEEDELE